MTVPYTEPAGIRHILLQICPPNHNVNHHLAEMPKEVPPTTQRKISKGLVYSEQNETAEIDANNARITSRAKSEAGKRGKSQISSPTYNYDTHNRSKIATKPSPNNHPTQYNVR